VNRLEGPPGDVVALAHVAARLLRRDRTTWQRLVRELPAVRGRAVEHARKHPRTAPAQRAGTVIWWVLLGIGLCAALGAAAMLDPPGRKNTYIHADDATAVAVVCGVVAVVLLGVALLLPVPRGHTPYAAMVLTVTTGSLLVLLVGYRLVVGTGDSRGFTPDQLRRALPLAALAALLTIGAAVRTHRVRRREPDPADADAHRRHTERWTTDLAALPTTSATGAAWEAELARIGPTTDPRAVSEAGQMTPVAWLVRTFVDPDLDVSGLLREE
jgi:hypothetical protein